MVLRTEALLVEVLPVLALLWSASLVAASVVRERMGEFEVVESSDFESEEEMIPVTWFQSRVR